MDVMNLIEFEQQMGAVELLYWQLVPGDLYPTREPLALTVFSRAAESLGTLSVRREGVPLRTRRMQELTFVGGPGTGEFHRVADEIIWVRVMSQRCGKQGLEKVSVRVIEQDPVHLQPQVRAGQIFDVTLAPERKVARPVARTPSAAVRTSTAA